jgi:hypothetical protein
MITTESAARAEIAAERQKPNWRESRHALPFHELSADEFEVFSFLLLKREHPQDDIRCYGGTGDGGRDIVHRQKLLNGFSIRLIQCKRYAANVSISVVRKDLAKVWVNVFHGTIPERPDEVVFYVAPNLTGPAKQLIDSQDCWRQKAKAAIQDHINGPVSDELARHAAEWWPNPTSEAALSLTERAKNYPDLIEEFFGIRKVIVASVSELAEEIRKRLFPPLADKGEFPCMERAPAAQSATTIVAADSLRSAFARYSTGLLRWPTTVSGNHWLERPEFQVVLDRVSSNHGSVNVVLGPPGCGKSALLARIGQQLSASGSTVLAIKTDQLRNVVDSAAKLAERLELPVLTDQAVLAVAEHEPVIILLDQLDALADLADLKSERLHILLNLIDKLAGHRNVEIVCSCREFEYQHDGRLNRLEAHTVRMAPPTWEHVSEVLVAHEVRADGWPNDAKSLLRTPHHLALFLKVLRGSGEHEVFTTYQQLFNDIWQEQVARPGGGRTEMLHELASQIAEREQLWIDRGRFEDRWAIVEALLAADLLCLTEDGFRVGFKHQSLFEFTRARAFALESVSLATYVLARQDALFARPTLWMALNCLRRANPLVYAREFDALWHQPDLRRHIKHLLIDFLSQIEQPSPADWEQSRLIAALHDASWRRKVLAGVTGKMVWFQLLDRSQLSVEMRKSPDEASDVIWVLVAAFAFDSDRCLELMEDNWLPDEPKLPLVWRTLTYVGNWSKRGVELAISVVRNSSIEQGSMWQTALAIAKNEPHLSVRLVAAWLDAARCRIVSSSFEDEIPSSRLGQLLSSFDRWYDVERLAEKVPADFALSLWPIVQNIVIRVTLPPSDYVIRYVDDGLCFTRVDRREYVTLDSPDHFFLAFDAAIRELAKRRPEEFLALVNKVANPDSRLLQRLLCRGMREVAPEHPGAALAFLTTDLRRFWLGGSHDDQGDSVELVAALAPHLTDDQTTHLVAAITEWEMYRERKGEPRDRGSIYARGHRFRLLAALPTGRLPDELRMVIEAERTALPEYVKTAQSRCGTEMRLIGSPVSRAGIEARSEAEIVALFDEFPDSTESHNPNDWMVGGSVQLSREFEDFTKAHPDRALAVVATLRPGIQERPASHLVRGLVAMKHPVAEVIAIVQQLDARGFGSQDFRETVALALDDLARTEGLPEIACDLLERWRIADWSIVDDAKSNRRDTDDSSRTTSILWQYGGTVSVPQGRFSVLSALTRGYLCRQPHAADRWLEMLSDHIEREESAASWRAMCLYLENVRCCTDQVRVRSFLERMFVRFPAVLRCDLGVRLLARVAELISEEIRQLAYCTVRQWDPKRGPQAFGELICLCHLLHPNDDFARTQVEIALSEPMGADFEWVLVGVAFAAAELWTEPSCRHRATDILCQLIPQPIEHIGIAALSVFQTRDELPLDEATLRLFRQIESHPDVLMRTPVGDSFYDHLLDAFVIDMELVCRISEIAVSHKWAGKHSAQNAFRLADSALIDISLRLQRSGGDYRSRGMKLFELLLDLGVAEAINLAQSNDLRLVSGGHPMRFPRRRNSRLKPPDSEVNQLNRND